MKLILFNDMHKQNSIGEGGGPAIAGMSAPWIQYPRLDRHSYKDISWLPYNHDTSRDVCHLYSDEDGMFLVHMHWCVLTSEYIRHGEKHLPWKIILTRKQHIILGIFKWKTNLVLYFWQHFKSIIGILAVTSAQLANVFVNVYNQNDASSNLTWNHWFLSLFG